MHAHFKLSCFYGLLLLKNVVAQQIYRNTAYKAPAPGGNAREWVFSAVSHESDEERHHIPPSVSLPLYGSVHHTAYWFADVRLGNPSFQTQSLIADTGSSVMGFPCADCSEKCGRHVDVPFNVSRSTSAETYSCANACPLCAIPQRPPNNFVKLATGGQCAYHIRYTEGSSLIGKWFEDDLWLLPFFGVQDEDPFAVSSIGYSNTAKIRAPFGCHAEETHLFISQDASGILGLEATSRFGPTPFVTTILAEMLGLARKKPTPPRNLGLTGTGKSARSRPVFALCLSSSGGVLTVGLPNFRYHIIQVDENGAESFVQVDAQQSTLVRSLPHVSRQPYGVSSDNLPHDHAYNDSGASLFGLTTVSAEAVLPTMLGAGSAGVLTSIGEIKPKNPSANQWPFPMSPNSRPNTLGRTPPAERPQVFYSQYNGEGRNNNLAAHNAGRAPAATSSSGGFGGNNIHNLSPAAQQHSALPQQNNMGFLPRSPAVPFVAGSAWPFYSSAASSVSSIGHGSPAFISAAEYGSYGLGGWSGVHGLPSSNRRAAYGPRMVAQAPNPNIANWLPGGGDYGFNSRAISARNDVPMLRHLTAVDNKTEDFGCAVRGNDAAKPRLLQALETADKYSIPVPDIGAIQPPAAASGNSVAVPPTWTTTRTPSNNANPGASGRKAARGNNSTGEAKSPSHNPPSRGGYYYPVLRDGLKWTPLVMDSDEEGGWPGSYVAVLEMAKIRGTAGETALVVPPAQIAQKTRSGKATGLPALVDSGTTLTYLPFLLYANLWTSLLKNVAAAKSQRTAAAARRLSESGDVEIPAEVYPSKVSDVDVIRVSGRGIGDMQRRMATYIQALTEEKLALKSRRMARMKDTGKVFSDNEMANAEQQKTADVDMTEREEQRLETSLAEELKGAHYVATQLLELEKDMKDAVQMPATLFDESASGATALYETDFVQQMMDVAQETSAKPRLLYEDLLLASEREHLTAGVVLLPDHPRDSVTLLEQKITAKALHEASQSTVSSSPRRRLAPVGLPNLDEECWYLADVENDLAYFPDVKLTFSGGVDYVWRPSGFLYRKGKTKVFCLTIIAERGHGENEEDDRDVPRRRRLDERLDERPDDEEMARLAIPSSMRRRLGETQPAVLGSSFFIGHDLVFHLGRWEIGFVEAECPTTDLKKRLKK